jgi:hypothetical protein
VVNLGQEAGLPVNVNKADLCGPLVYGWQSEIDEERSETQLLTHIQALFTFFGLYNRSDL